jgi:hypothetical protein
MIEEMGPKTGLGHSLLAYRPESISLVPLRKFHWIMYCMCMVIDLLKSEKLIISLTLRFVAHMRIAQSSSNIIMPQ